MPAPSKSKQRKKPQKSAELPVPAIPPAVETSVPRGETPDFLLRVSKSACRSPLRRLLPDMDCLTWGLEASGAVPASCNLALSLAALAFGRGIPVNGSQQWSEAAESFQDTVRGATITPQGAALAICWGYALPHLVEPLGDILWWRTLEELQVLAQTAREQTAESSWQRLMLAGELTAVLAGRLEELPSCIALRKLSKGALEDWGKQKEAAVTTAFVEGGVHARLVLASAVRQSQLLTASGKKVRGSLRETMHEIAAGLCVTMRSDGTQTFGPMQMQTNDAQLFKVAAKICDEKGLGKAAKHAIMKGEAKLKQTDEADLPETFLDQPNANLNAWRANWGKHHGRMAVNYSRGVTQLEVGGGRVSLLAGAWSATVTLGGKPLQPTSDWDQTCWFNDDEVYYIELQRFYTNEIQMHRQLMLLRDDDLMMLADAVVTTQGGELDYQGRLTLGPGMTARNELETRELIIADEKKDRAIVMPIDCPEWRISRSPGSLFSDGDQIVLQHRGKNRLQSTLFLSLNPHRFEAQRTWRQLTVGENLQSVPRDVAIAYRLQIGNDQWAIYRSLGELTSRSFLGQNQSSEFFVGRFDPTTGVAEEMLSVEAE